MAFEVPVPSAAVAVVADDGGGVVGVVVVVAPLRGIDLRPRCSKVPAGRQEGRRRVDSPNREEEE